MLTRQFGRNIGKAYISLGLHALSAPLSGPFACSLCLVCASQGTNCMCDLHDRTTAYTLYTMGAAI